MWSALASIAGGLIASRGQKKTNQMQIGSAREQMAFQRNMSNTAYQRSMKDMRRAGLNPILAGKVGGASTPGGAQANIGNPAAAGVAAAGQSANTAIALEKLKQERMNTKRLKELGLSPMEMQYTPFNQGGSMLLNAGLDTGRAIVRRYTPDDSVTQVKNDAKNVEDAIKEAKQRLGRKGYGAKQRRKKPAYKSRRLVSIKTCIVGNLSGEIKKMTKVKFNTAYGDRVRVTADPVGESLTQQHFKKSTDIVEIIKKHDRTGIIEHVARGMAQYGDYSEVNEYREALDMVNNANASFMELPAEIRAMFDNDAGAFFEFATNPKNEAKMQELGLAEKPEMADDLLPVGENKQAGTDEAAEKAE